MCIYIYIHIHTYTHLIECANIHTDIRSYMHACMSYIHYGHHCIIYIHVIVLAIHTCMYAGMHTCIRIDDPFR